jgi:hypothetical protein
VPPARRRTQLAIERLGHETLVYDLERHRAFCLNRPAALVWRLCDGRRPVGEIAERLERKLGRPMPLEAVGWTLRRLSRCGLLLARVPATPAAGGVSRRDLVRRLGLAIALAPNVFLVVAPTAAQAASATTAAACFSNPAANAGKCCTNIATDRLCVRFGGIGLCVGALC